MNEACAAAVNVLKKKFQGHPRIGIITGSGLGGLVDMLQGSMGIGFEDIPHFPVSSVTGHAGEVILGRLADIPLFVLAGRIHYYEGYTLSQVVFPIRVMAAFGIKVLIITNAAGGVSESLQARNIVIIRDHINLMGDNPLAGDSRRLDLSRAYSPGLRKLACLTAEKLGMRLPSGVYAAISGPSYETPAEIEAMRRMGADMVGMSTVPEVIMANRLEMKVLGLSLITNMAAGFNGNALSHQEVIKVSQEASLKFNNLIESIVKRIDNEYL